MCLTPEPLSTYPLPWIADCGSRYAHVAGSDGLVANNPAAAVPGRLSTGNPDFPSLSTVEFL